MSASSGHTGAMRPVLPDPRGPVSEEVLSRLHGGPALAGSPSLADDPWTGDDAPLALYLMYELSYRGFESVDDRLEWEPDVVRWRRDLSRALIDRVSEECGPPRPIASATLADELTAIVTGAEGPSLSAFVESEGTASHLREFAIHRSAYQLKEADPHTWVIPRLSPEVKAPVIEVQTDEYGGGVAGRSHAELFAATMRALGLDDRYGFYLAAVPGVTLSTVNLLSAFGLERRWRGAVLGHLSLFEMTSVGPMTRYARRVREVAGEAAAEFYDVHVDADAHHSRVMTERLSVAIERHDPDIAPDVAFGGRALMTVESRFAQSLLDSWWAGRSSLRGGVPVPLAA